MNAGVGVALLGLLTCGGSLATAQQSCSLTLFGTWQLRFAAGATQHDATLRMNGCSGEMTVAFFSDYTQRREEISQRMTLTQGSRGIRISGYYPVYSGTNTRHPSYNADNLEYSVNTLGQVTFRNCDAGGNCSPVEILSEPRGVRISLENSCRAKMYVAILYQAVSGQWRRRGWWVVNAGTSRETDIATLNPNVYFFAEDSLSNVWNGEGKIGAVTRYVITSAFDRPDTTTAGFVGEGLRTVSFFKQIVSTNLAVHTQQFTCD